MSKIQGRREEGGRGGRSDNGGREESRAAIKPSQ